LSQPSNTSIKRNNLINKTEPFLFYVTIILLTAPIFCYDYFVTNDGPAHVYNANLIQHFFGIYHQQISALFNFNTSIEPNWIGHFILIIFKSFTSGAFSEKLLIASIFALFPITMRNLVITLNKDNAWLAWLSVPFAFHFMILLGFYNFSIGIVLFILAINYAIKSEFEFKGKQVFILILLSLALYFSHLIVYALFFLFVSLGILLKRKSNLKSLATFIGLQIPFLLFCLLFVLHHSKGKTADALELEVLFDWLLKARPLIVYNELEEAWFGYTYNLIIVIILCSGIIFSRLKKIKMSSTSNFLQCLAFMFFMLILFFVAPNELVSGGFLNIRMLLLFYIFLIACLSMFTYPKIIAFPILLVLLSITAFQQNKKFTNLNVLSAEASELTSIQNHVKEGKTMIPLNYSKNWLHTNLSSYIASDKLILLFDNYEANTPHFPLKWVEQAQPNPLLGNFSYSLNPTISIAPYENKTGLHVNYIVRWCYQHAEKDTIALKTNQEISNDFKLIYTSPKGNAELFERR
jgi:hypothetical protein